MEIAILQVQDTQNLFSLLAKMGKQNYPLASCLFHLGGPSETLPYSSTSPIRWKLISTIDNVKHKPKVIKT